MCDFCETLFDELDAKERADDDKVGAKEKRKNIFDWCNKAVEDMKEDKYDRVFEVSWINFGLYLNIDCSEDHSFESLHS